MNASMLLPRYLTQNLERVHIGWVRLRVVTNVLRPFGRLSEIICRRVLARDSSRPPFVHNVPIWRNCRRAGHTRIKIGAESG